MKKAIVAIGLLVSLAAVSAAEPSQSTNGSQDSAIAAALTPLPESLRSRACVVRLDSANHPELIRDGERSYWAHVMIRHPKAN
jgi:hypothetical protein